jgi:hypothetical protein
VKLEKRVVEVIVEQKVTAEVGRWEVNNEE